MRDLKQVCNKLKRLEKASRLLAEDNRPYGANRAIHTASANALSLARNLVRSTFIEET